MTMQFEHRARPEGPAAPTAATWQRRYDVDWLRILAMGMLIIYHVVISFQPWAIKIFFIQNEQSLEGLLKLILLLAGTLGVSMLIFEYVIKRLKWIRPLFGMKLSYV
jgi:hypothetical protein